MPQMKSLDYVPLISAHTPTMELSNETVNGPNGERAASLFVLVVA